MADKLKVRCNGPKKDVNEFSRKELEKLAQDTVILRVGPTKRELPARLVVNCKHCTSGKVELTRAMLETILG